MTHVISSRPNVEEDEDALALQRLVPPGGPGARRAHWCSDRRRRTRTHATQIYQWRAKAAQEQSVSDRERQPREENACLKRQLADKTEEVEILEKSAPHFAKKLD